MALLLCPGAVDGGRSCVQGVHEVQELQVKHHVKQHIELKFLKQSWSLLFPKPMRKHSELLKPASCMHITMYSYGDGVRLCSP